MRSLNHAVFLRVNEFGFLLCKSTPQNEDNFVAFVAERLDNGVSESLPSEARVGVRFVRSAKRMKCLLEHAVSTRSENQRVQLCRTALKLVSRTCSARK